MVHVLKLITSTHSEKIRFLTFFEIRPELLSQYLLDWLFSNVAVAHIAVAV